MEATLTILERTAFLKSTEVFAQIPTDVLAQIAARGRELHFDAGQTIFREGEPNSGAYMVIEGLVEFRKGRALEGVRKSGLGFGELALGEGEPHTFAAVAAEHTHVLNISNEIFFDSMLDYPEIGVAMVRILAGRLTEAAQRVHDLEGQIAHLANTLRDAGVAAPQYVSGKYPRVVPPLE
jgi:CRP/FNR family transcriptional regulator, cyclic AMP receptor protein